MTPSLMSFKVIKEILQRASLSQSERLNRDCEEVPERYFQVEEVNFCQEYAFM